MNPHDIPTTITRLVYDDPIHRGQLKISQNDMARSLAHYWPAIEQHIRQQIAAEIDTAADRVFTQHPDSIAMSARGLGLRAAARITRGDTHQPHAIDIPAQHDGAHDQNNHDAYTL